MPRQPYKSYCKNSPANLNVGARRAIGALPSLEALVGNCLMAWPNAEAEMALALGQLLGVKQHTAAIAVFQIVRRFTTQRSIMEEAAKVSLNTVDTELVGAILNVHKSAETERTALAHAHFGIADTIPDGLVWMTTTDYVIIRSLFTLQGDREMDAARMQRIASMLWVYKERDLKTILEDFQALAWIWHDLIIYLQSSDPQRAELYRQLCERPRIAQELERLRREKTPPAPLE